jgi:hypothetical protein
VFGGTQEERKQKTENKKLKANSGEGGMRLSEDRRNGVFNTDDTEGAASAERSAPESNMVRRICRDLDVKDD